MDKIKITEEMNLEKEWFKQAKEPTWAEQEVEIACKKENPDRKDDEFDYGCACYESALKAYNSLVEDDHSGFSIGLTKRILNRLIDGKPLTPIDDTDDIWSNDIYGGATRNEKMVFQCKRMSSLFKYVYTDGKVFYRDNDRDCCVNINNPSVVYHFGLVSRIINEMFPITMPYMPEDRPIKVYVEDFLYDEKNGDFDTVGIFYAVKPNGEKVDINRYFREIDNGWQECNEEEYIKRKENKVVIDHSEWLESEAE